MTPTVRLIRLEENHDHGTFGVLIIMAKVFCITLEPPDKENLQSKSSIPAQQYQCQRIVSPKRGETFQILNVPDRSHILFHAGNIDVHTEGCILLGQYFGKLKNNRAILNSGKTFKDFMTLMVGIDEFHLTIKEAY